VSCNRSLGGSHGGVGVAMPQSLRGVGAVREAGARARGPGRRWADAAVAGAQSRAPSREARERRLAVSPLNLPETPIPTSEDIP
jgi:hypothetical protein